MKLIIFQMNLRLYYILKAKQIGNIWLEAWLQLCDTVTVAV